MCLTPITLNRDYRKMGKRYEDAAHRVPCGKCPVCLKRRQLGWLFRLREERKQSLSAAFLTLTYDEDNLPLSPNGLPTLKPEHLTKFWKRYRKKTHNKIKYYAIGEYGTQTQRPHYHAITFNCPKHHLDSGTALLDSWKHGHIRVDKCEMGSMAYVTKYVMAGAWEPRHCEETGLIDDRIPQFSRMSKKLGMAYLTPQMVKWHTENLIPYTRLPGGEILSMPRYFKDKIFSKKEREQMNLEAEKFREEFENQFNNPIHEIEWKKDQYRKVKKLRRLKRAAL